MKSALETPHADVGKAQLLGQAVQGLVMGPLLFMAAIKLVSLAGSLAPFKYQGF